MSSEFVSKDELKSILEVQSKNVEQLTMIANHLSTIITSIDKQMALNTKEHEIIKEKFAALPDLIGEKLNYSSMAKDIGFTKWFVGIIGLVVVISSVVVNGLEKTAVANNADELIRVIENKMQSIEAKNRSTR